MEAGGGSVRVFDGTTDFRVWRARVENELMRYHLLGYVMVEGYDGSQAFLYDGEEVPAKCPVTHVEDVAQAALPASASASAQRQASSSRSFVKEELALRNAVETNGHGAGLSRLEVLAERAEAKSILQRYLHPDVECVILNKNVFDSWVMLCALYGGTGAVDMYEMHRVLHHMRLGDKRGESAREFITRWEMVAQQYATATGIELTDAFRSIMLVQTLPSAWRATVTTWRGNKPYVSYPELVTKVIAERERLQAQGELSSSSKSSAKSGGKSSSSAEKTTEKGSAKNESKLVTSSPAKSVAKGTVDLSASSARPSTSSSQKPSLSGASARSPREKKATTSSPRSEKSETRSDKSRHEKQGHTDGDEKQVRRVEATHEKHDSYSKNDNYNKHKSYSKHDGYDKRENYDSPSRYDKSPRDKYPTRDRYERPLTKYEHYDRYDNGHGDGNGNGIGNGYNKKGPVTCFYCLKKGHHLRQCWFLQSDMETKTTHDERKKYSCVVTNERSGWMVQRIEAYLDEEKRKGGYYRAPQHETRDRIYEIDCQQQQQPMQMQHPASSSTHSFQMLESMGPPSQGPAGDYRKRSRSVFQPAEGRMPPRDPRAMRSQSVFRGGTDLDESPFPPRKRSRTPSFERALRSGGTVVYPTKFQ